MNQVPRRKSGNPTIASAGAMYAGRRAQGTRDRLAQAMRDMELEIERNAGIYPFADGEVSTAEVIRRAGLSPTLLQKDRHRSSRTEVAIWVETVRCAIKRGRKVVRKAVTDRVDVAKREVDVIMQRWTQAELEYADQAIELARLRAECTDLRAENAKLRAALSGGNVLPLR